MKNKLGFVLAFVFLVLTVVLVSNFASATTWTENSVQIKDMTVYVKGQEVWQGRCALDNSTRNTWACDAPISTGYMPSLEACEKVDVKVVITGGDATADNAIVRAWTRIEGQYLEDETGKFDIVRENNQYVKTLYLTMPCSVKSFKNATLHVEVEADNDVRGISSADIPFDIQRTANELSIESLDVTQSCGTSCNTVTADVVVKNTGNHDLDDIYVKATIKELGVSGTKYIEVLVPYRTHDDSTSEEVTIALQLPANVQAGTYTMEISAYNGDTETTMTQQFSVGGSYQTASVDIAPQTTRQDIVQGESAAFTFIVTNKGTSTQTFSVETTGLDTWATGQTTPATFSLAPGQSQLVTVYASTKDDAVTAEHLFSVKVNYGTDSKTVNFVGNVTEKKSALDLKTTLMIVGIVLAVAIIILLIVLLAQKTRTSEKTEESYY